MSRPVRLLFACCVIAQVHAISSPRPVVASDRRDSTKPVLSAAIQPAKAPLLARRSESEAPKITRRQCVLFSITYVAYVAIYFARKPVAVVKSTLETDLGMSIASLGMIDTSMLAAYAAGQFMTGTVVRILGRNAALIGAFALCGALTAAFGGANSLGAFSAIWGAVGLFASVVNPLLVLFVADLFPASLRATAVSLWQTAQQCGGVAANTVASGVLARHGWRSVFRCSGAIVFAFAPILALALLKRPAQDPSAAAESAPSAASGGASRSVLSVPGLGSVGAAYTLVKMCRYCLMFWLPYFFVRHVEMSPAAAALTSTVFDLAGVLGSVVTGLLCDRYFGGRMVPTTFPFAILAALAFFCWGLSCLLEGGTPLSSRVHVAYVALTGFLVAGPDGVLGGAASRNLCEYAGATALAASASGLVNGCGSLGAILQGSLTGGLVGRAGWSGLFFTLAGAMLATSIAVRPAVAVEAEAKRAN